MVSVWLMKETVQAARRRGDGVVGILLPTIHKGSPLIPVSTVMISSEAARRGKRERERGRREGERATTGRQELIDFSLL